MKTLLTLLLFMPTILFAKNQIIYCYEINDKYQSIYSSDSINYFEIDDKKKRIDEFKIYYDDYGISKFYFSGEDWVLEFDDPNKEIEIIEVGPGKVLQGLFKKVDRSIPTSSASLL